MIIRLLIVVILLTWSVGYGQRIDSFFGQEAGTVIKSDDDIDWSIYKTENDLNKLTPEQLNSMPISELKRIASNSGNETISEFFDYYTSIALMRLGYDDNLKNLSKSKQKIKSFQKKVGNNPTGILTYGDVDNLNNCNAKFMENKVLPLGTASVYIYEDYARAEGSLVIDDGNDTYLEETDSAFPVTKTMIRCDRNDGICTVFVADVIIPNYEDSKDTYYLNTDIDVWQIDSWRSDKVIATSSGNCRTTTMTMNSTTNEIVQLTTNASTKGCDLLGSEIPKLERPLLVKSVDPMKYTYGYWIARSKKTAETCVSDSIKNAIKQFIQ